MVESDSERLLVAPSSLLLEDRELLQPPCNTAAAAGAYAVFTARQVAFMDGERLLGEEAAALAGRFPERVYQRTRDFLGKPAKHASVQDLLVVQHLPYEVLEQPDRKTVLIKDQTGQEHSAEELVVRSLTDRPARSTPPRSSWCVARETDRQIDRLARSTPPRSSWCIARQTGRQTDRPGALRRGARGAALDGQTVGKPLERRLHGPRASNDHQAHWARHHP
jgi:hypothetical protein